MSATYGPEDFAAEFAVSRETMDRLAAYDATLLDWQSRMNLIARSTIEDRWARHYRDSAQLMRHLPQEAKSLLDLGSGAGFPGLVLTALAADQLGAVHLVDSVGKKARFLSAAAEAMELKNVSVSAKRIEALPPSKPDIITARALAALPKLLGLVAPFVGPKTTCLFPKGQHVVDELTEATKSWHMTVEQIPSVTASESVILAIRNLAPR
ncbi:MAG: 16S rRNA (guanine(527)-N(7))-methyltransferase RsmG [Pseudomonadota bacterium]